MTTFTAEQFRQARKSLGLSQQQLGALVGYPRKMTVSDWETERNPIPPPVARLLQAYLDGYRPKDWPNT
jgi:transcriptional regulator with XRE-family HTH domain